MQRRRILNAMNIPGPMSRAIEEVGLLLAHNEGYKDGHFAFGGVLDE